MEASKNEAEVRKLMDSADADTRRQLAAYLRLRGRLVELTGEPDINESLPFEILGIADKAARIEAAQVAKRMRALARSVFSRL